MGLSHEAMIGALASRLAKTFADCPTQEEQRFLLVVLLTEFVDAEKIQALYSAYQLIERVEETQAPEGVDKLVEIPAIITPNIEDDELPMTVRDLLILGHCDKGRIICPREGYSLWHALPDTQAEEGEMQIRRYVISDRSCVKRYFVEYYSHKTSAFDNGW